MSQRAVDLVALEDDGSLADWCADFVARRVTANPALALTLPTGATPLGLYARLRREHAAGRFSLDAATVFMLDEYLDLPSYPTDSFAAYLREHLGDLLFNDTTRVHVMDPGDPMFAERLDAALDAVGGLDLAIVGVGRNGHVGFNEPGSSIDARTHVVSLSPTTLEANFPHQLARRPATALTIGLRDLRRARSVLMMVAGEDKGDVAAALARGVVDPDLPATSLLGHDDLTIVMASRLVP